MSDDANAGQNAAVNLQRQIVVTCGNSHPNAMPSLRRHTDAANGTEYTLGTRWTITSGGSTGFPGQGITLRWSVVPDGTTIPSGVGEPTAGSNLRAWLNGRFGSQANWLPLIEGMFNSWSAVTGVTYIYEANDDGASYYNSPGFAGVRGDVRLGGKFIDGFANVLAFNELPNGGDMVIDTSDAVLNNTADLFAVLAHEHGHGLGLLHVCPGNGTKLMEPNLSVAHAGPQFDDILAANVYYGDRNEKGNRNNTIANATPLGTVGGSANVQNLLSITRANRTADVDFFTFNTATAGSLTLRVEPIGGTYLSGPQNFDGSCSPGTLFDANSQLDLSVELLNASGTTVIQSANATGLGGTETITFTNLLPGSYSIRVTTPNATGVSLAQMYRMTSGVVVPIQATIDPVTPSPRPTTVADLVVRFTQPVDPASIDLSDFTLRHEGSVIPINGATLTATDGNTRYTVGNLTSRTGRPGRYELSVGPNIASTGGAQLGTTVTRSWVMTSLVATQGNSNVRLSNGGGSVINVQTDTEQYAFDSASVPVLTIEFGPGGNDTLALEYLLGSPTPAGGININGGGNVTVESGGFTLGSTFEVAGGSLLGVSPFASAPVSLANVDTLRLRDGRYEVENDLQNRGLQLDNGADVQFNLTQRIGTMLLSGNSQARLSDGLTLAATALAVEPDAALDIRTGFLVVDGPTSVADFAALRAAIVGGYAAGAWTGRGIKSSAITSGNRAIGYAAATGPGTFGGVPIDAGDFLARFTASGDADLDGTTNFADLLAVARNYNLNGTSWSEGDFTYDGQTNFGDLLELARNYNSSVAAMPRGGSRNAVRSSIASRLGLA